LKIVNFSQDNEEWLEWRRGGIGASDISVIMGINPYKSQYELWEEKCGYKTSPSLNKAMVFGIENEGVARDWLNTNLSLRLIPICVEDKKDSFMRASLDGYDNFQNLLVEIKCPISKSVIYNARELKAFHDYWVMQVQWQLMVADIPHGKLAIWDHENHCCLMLDIYNDAKLNEKMRSAAKEFWKRVQFGTPPPLENKEYKEIEDKDLHKKLIEWYALSEEEKIIKEKKDKMKEQIIKESGGGNIKLNNFFIRFNPPKNTYNFEQMKLEGIDLEKYKKQAGKNGFYTIKFKSD